MEFVGHEEKCEATLIWMVGQLKTNKCWCSFKFFSCFEWRVVLISRIDLRKQCKVCLIWSVAHLGRTIMSLFIDFLIWQCLKTQFMIILNNANICISLYADIFLKVYIYVWFETSLKFDSDIFKPFYCKYILAYGYDVAMKPNDLTDY